MPLYKSLESAETISPPSDCASVRESAVFPTAVGPRITSSGLVVTGAHWPRNPLPSQDRIGDMFTPKELSGAVEFDGDKVNAPIDIEIAIGNILPGQLQ